MADSLITRYRPENLDEVIGQQVIVNSLRAVVESKSSHSFLFVGPSGCGKTTLARITAKMFGCKSGDIREIDAATYTGIDDIRTVTSTLTYRPIGGSTTKAMIIDECHALSKSAWQALLKIVEEPPEFAYWFLCTTDEARVPQTVKTRCVRYEVKKIPTNTIRDYLGIIVEAESLTIDGGILDLCSRQAYGSPRQALVNLVACAQASSRTEAIRLLNAASENKEPTELAQALMRNAPWTEICRIIEIFETKEEDPEAVRHVVLEYFGKTARNLKDDSKIPRALQIMDAFNQPFSRSDGMNPLILACGRALFS